MAKSHKARSVLTSPVLSHICPLMTVIMLIPLQHQRQVILFDPMWLFSNACHWPYSYVYIIGLEESSCIFMPHCNWMLSMKWNTLLLEDCLPLDTNLNLHIAHCIQIEVLQACNCRLLQYASLLKFEDTRPFGYAYTLFVLLVRQKHVFWRFPWISYFCFIMKLLCLVNKLCDLTEFVKRVHVLFSPFL